ncbi:MAG: AgmX/PglI C-terminal domain-containing protein [Polyangiales bacterium]
MKQLSLVLSLAALCATPTAFAQRGPGASPETVGAPGTAIRRQTATNTTTFGEIPPERDLPRGEVGGTGEVISRGPQGQLRGGVEPSPDAVDMSRPVGPGDVARIVRARDPQFRACYDRGRTRVPTLQGRINMRFVVRANGSLDELDVRGLPQAPEVATCLRENLGTLRLPRPEGGTLTFQSGMNFSPPPAPPPRRGRSAPRR